MRAFMRATLHLMSAEDALRVRPVVQPVLDVRFRGTPFARVLGRSLAERWPDAHPAALGVAVHYLSPLVQIPPRGVWGARGRPVLATLESWLARRQFLPEWDDALLAGHGPDRDPFGHR